MARVIPDAQPVSVVAGEAHPIDPTTEQKIPEGAVTVEFVDGTYAIFSAVWRDDGDADLVMATGRVR